MAEYLKKSKKALCLFCKSEYQTRNPWQKYCTRECGKKNFNKIHGRTGDSTISAGTVGALSELVVCADLLARGYSVFRSVSPHSFCDIIAFKNGVLMRVEVKTGYKSPQSRLIMQPDTSNNDFDLLAIYIRAEKKVYYKDKALNILDDKSL